MTRQPAHRDNPKRDPEHLRTTGPRRYLTTGAAAAEPIGRAHESERLREMLDRAATGPAGVLLSGQAGIGKTTLWRATMAEARHRGYRILETRAVEAEVQLAFGALADLIGGHLDDVADELPEPQREALDLALQRTAADGRAPAPLAVSLGTLAVLRALVARSPLIVAVDDLPWLDAASARVLEYALRRLDVEPIGLLLAMRTDRADPPAPAPAAVAAFAAPIERLHIGPLDIDAIDAVLRASVGASFRRPDLARIHAESGGNPFFALEMARAAQRSGVDTQHMASGVSVLVADRLDALPEDLREPLAAVAALAQPTRDMVEAAFPVRAQGLDSAIDAGVLEAEGDRLHFTHPLLAAAAYGRLGDDDRRRLHRRLSDVAPDLEQRARHRALSSPEPDEEVATQLETAAANARSRGATDVAAELAREAVTHTPDADVQALRRRTVAAAAYWVLAGDPVRARALLEELVARLKPGVDRAEALRALADVRSGDDWHEKLRLLDQALAEAGEDHRLRSAILEQRSQARYHVLVDAEGSLADAMEALAEARLQDDPAVLCSALLAADFAQRNAGGPGDEALLEEALALGPQVDHLRVFLWPSFAAALVAIDSDRLGEARSRLAALRERAVALGDWDSLPLVALNLGWVAFLTGDWTAALGFAVEAERASRQNGQDYGLAVALVMRGTIAAAMSRVDEAREAAREGMAIAERVGGSRVEAQHHGVLGFIALSMGAHSAAEAELRRAVEPPLLQGYLALNAHFVPDWAEALVHLGRSAEAVALVAPYEERARRDRLASALAALLRVRGLAAAAAGDEAGAREAFLAAIAQHDLVDQPFERARTLLGWGESLRRFRQRGKAREALAAALDLFTRLGAVTWRDRASAELARTGHRVPGAELSATEQQVAELVAAGRTNREVAEALFMSPHTVEAHLTRIYRSLGVRGRTEMTRELAARTKPGDGGPL